MRLSTAPYKTDSGLAHLSFGTADGETSFVDLVDSQRIGSLHSGSPPGIDSLDSVPSRPTDRLQMDLIARLEEIEKNFAEIERQLASPELSKDRSRFADIARRHAELQPVVETFARYRRIAQDIEAARELLAAEDDPAQREYLKEEIADQERSLEATEGELRQLLLPKDEVDERGVIVEIRGAAGGDEAKLFAGDLFRMYERYAESRGWSTEVLSSSASEIGGYNEITFAVKGPGVYRRLKHEAGTHRVQRVPVTESSGRIHTSTATVAVLPEAEEVDVTVDPKDIRIDVFRSSGPGGQSVNTTDSAVRITHMPTGIVVSCQDEKSQIQNREKAMRILRSRLLDLERRRQAEETAEARRSQIRSGDRSEKVRTYNFPQNRVTDHRISKSVHDVEGVLAGNLDSFIDSLIEREQAELLANAE
jgi:peptide chain release factor 1